MEELSLHVLKIIENFSSRRSGQRRDYPEFKEGVNETDEYEVTQAFNSILTHYIL